MFDLSMVWILRSSSANDWGSIELAKASATTMRLAVGLMSCSSSNWMQVVLSICIFAVEFGYKDTKYFLITNHPLSIIH